jgi:hypothetical protein
MTMGKKTAAPTHTGRAAYHQGPPEIEYAGRRWQIGVSQPLTDAEFAAMQERGDFDHFGFTYAADPAATLPEEN